MMKLRARFESTAVAAALLCFAVSSQLHAQVIRGRLLEEKTATPVVAGFVRLVDSAGHRVSEVLSTATGAYQLKAQPGTYTILVERIGYQTYQTKPFVLDSSIVRDLTLPQVAIELPAITNNVDTRCGEHKQATPETAALWEEVRKALDLTSWTANRGTVMYELLSIRQTLEPQRMTVSSETREVHTNTLMASPWAALDQDSLLKKGFIQEEVKGYPNYYGPDAELIQSQGFQDTHCFRAVTNRRNAKQIGLAFEPDGTVKPSDIRGTLWIDRASHELRQIEFSYNHLPVDAPLSTAGGVVNFVRLPTGMWIVSDWTINAPIMSNEIKPAILDAATKPVGRTIAATLVAIQRDNEKALSAFIGEDRIYTAPDDGH